MTGLRRRDLLMSTAWFALCCGVAKGAIIGGKLPWHPNAGTPPALLDPQGWLFFNDFEAALVEAIADRIIPTDELGPGGKHAGCAVFIDRQLAGPYGRSEGLYVQPPFLKGSKTQGSQDRNSPALQYRAALADLDQLCRSTHSGRGFANLPVDQQDEYLSALESGNLSHGAADRDFFGMIVKDVKQGFFADPLYGGNRDMAGWRLIGYPGARYDYRDWVSRHNEAFPLPPVSIMGRNDWMPQGG